MSARVFVDMDGVVVDFDSYKESRGLTGDEVKKIIGAYLDMPAIAGAIEAVRSLIGMGFEVWLATKPPTGVAHAYSDKAAWVFKHLPELKRRIVITHDKGLLGNANDFLCDDRSHKANCEKFSGTLLRFVDGYHWPQALAFFRGIKAAAPPTAAGASAGRCPTCGALRDSKYAIAVECSDGFHYRSEPLFASPTQDGEERAGDLPADIEGALGEFAKLCMDQPSEDDYAIGLANLRYAIAQALAATPSPEDDATVRVPRELTAENGAKAALMSEFKIECERDCPECVDLEVSDCFVCGGKGVCTSWITVDWTTIKAIWKAGIAHFAAAQTEGAVRIPDAEESSSVVNQSLTTQCGNAG